MTDKQSQHAKKEIDREYLKKQMRERATTEAPETKESSPSNGDDTTATDTKAVSATLQETKEAIEEISEKLERLADQVAEPATKNGSKKSSKGA